MDRPVAPNMYGSPSPDPERIDPPGGFAHMPPAAPDPVEGSTAPMTGDVPPMRSEVPQAKPPQPEQSAAPSMRTPDTIARFDPWNYRENAGLGDGSDIIGYRVETTDGHIGKIDEASTIVGESYLVVDTGPWIFGKKVLLPAGTVHHVDHGCATPAARRDGPAGRRTAAGSRHGGQRARRAAELPAVATRRTIDGSGWTGHSRRCCALPISRSDGTVMPWTCGRRPSRRSSTSGTWAACPGRTAASCTTAGCTGPTRCTG